MANPYETLDVATNASQEDIRRAYRKAAKETHPDLNPGKPEAEKRFKEINAAYDIIGDADKRKRYDAGEIDETGTERQPERHFYREYAEADPSRRYSRREASAGQRGNEGSISITTSSPISSVAAIKAQPLGRRRRTSAMHSISIFSMQ
jgi:curved DNA-binding protein CbpA